MGLIEQEKIGFKKTEIGLIPEDWKVFEIGEKFKFKNGLNKEKEYFGYGNPIVNYMDVFKNPGIHATEVVGKVSLSSKEIDNYNVRAGDVFFTRTSEIPEEIGMSAVLLEEIPKCVFSGFVLRGRSLDLSIDNSFKKYCFRSKLVRRQIISTCSYTTRALTNGRLLSVVKFPLPPTLEEQKAIATALSDTDDLIIGLEKLIAKKKAIKQGAMQQLLTPPNKGGKRLPGFSGEWEEIILEDLADVIDPHPSHRAPAEIKSGIPFLGIGDLDERGNIIAKEPRIVDYSVLIAHRKRYNLNENLLGLGRVASIGKVVELKNDVGDYTISPTLGVLKSNHIDHNFLKHILKSQYIKDYFQKIMSGSTRSSVGMIVLRRIPIPTPQPDEQRAIARILNDMDKEIEAVESKKAKYEQIKQGMMQELLTGKTRLV